MFGHPEVYFLILPFVGLHVFGGSILVARRYADGRLAYGSTGLILRVALLSFLVWGHHLFAVSFSPVAKFFFVLASLYIFIPMFDIAAALFLSYLNIPFAGRYLGLFYRNRPQLILAAAAFLTGGVLSIGFLISQSSGRVHGTRYVVAHFHAFFVLFLFSLLVVPLVLVLTDQQTAAIRGYIYFPRIVVVSGLCVFLLSAIIGYMGVLRRVYTVAVTSIPSVIVGAAIYAGVAVFISSAVHVLGSRMNT